MANVDQAGLEVDLGPGQSEQFREAHTGVGGGCEQGPVGGQAGVEEFCDLLMGEHALVAAARAWPFACIESCQGVVVDDAPSEREREDASEWDERTGDRLR